MIEDCVWQDEDLSGRSFAGEEMTGVTLRSCRLIGTSFRGAELRDARFEHCIGFAADEEGCTDFSYANLREAQFAHCDFTAAEFANISAYGMALEHCQLGGVSFTGADFRLPIGEASELTGFSMRHCNFAYGDFSNTFLKGSELTDNRMIEVILTNSVLEDVVFTGSDLSNAQGEGLSLQGADLRGALFNRLDPASINLSGVRITLEQTRYLLEPLGVIIAERDGSD
jgi:fluoroquinolone resistance protein